jgi:hypothetical protein
MNCQRYDFDVQQGAVEGDFGPIAEYVAPKTPESE